MSFYFFYHWTGAIDLIINSLVAIGTLLLAGITFWQAQQLKREYKNKKLDDVIEWATTLMDWEVTKTPEAMKEMQDDERPLLPMLLALISYVEGIQRLERESLLKIQPIAATFKKKSLAEAITRVQMELSEQQKLIANIEMTISNIKSKELPAGFDRATGEAQDHKRKLNSLAANIIKEVNEIKSS